MKPIRGQRKRAVAHDPWDYGERTLEHSQIEHILSDEGAIESYETDRRMACGCGCLRPAAGFCAVCGETACAACFGLCDRCHMPLCPRHSVFVNDTRTSSVRRLCRECHESATRARRVRGFVRVVLSPFVRFEEESRGSG